MTVSRRTFLGRGSVTVAAAGLLSSIPGLSSLLGTAGADGPALDGAAADGAAAADASAGSLTEPLVAHVRDVSSGEISLFTGTREVLIRDPQLANRLLRATR
jgi:hypothetical protein